MTHFSITIASGPVCVCACVRVCVCVCMCTRAMTAELWELVMTSSLLDDFPGTIKESLWADLIGCCDRAR